MNNLKKYRREANLTQVQLAEDAHITREYVSLIERGLRSPGLATAKKICSLVGKSIEDVFPN